MEPLKLAEQYAAKATKADDAGALAITYTLLAIAQELRELNKQMRLNNEHQEAQAFAQGYRG